MGVWQGFKSIFIGDDEIEDEEYVSYRQPAKPEAPVQTTEREEPVQEEPVAAPQPKPAPRAAQNRAAYSRQSNQQRAREVKMSTTSESSFDLVLARPNTYRDVNAIGDDLNAGKTVILNLEKVKQDDATRILDFLSGVAYANDDEIKMMAQKTYAIMPSSVHFSGVDLVNELEHNGYNF